MNSEKFILVNLNQSISRARQAIVKEQRDKWIAFGVIVLCYICLIGWFLEINNRTNTLIVSRNNTISKIKLDTQKLQKDAKINLSKKDITSSYELGKKYIPWSKKLMQLSEMTPFNMCITKLNYTNNALNISAISKIEDKDVKEMALLNDFMNTIKNNEDFYKEFDKITIEKTKKLQYHGRPYLSFEIRAKLKNKIKNRLDDIVIIQNFKSNENKEEVEITKSEPKEIEVESESTIVKSPPVEEKLDKINQVDKITKINDDNSKEIIKLAKSINISNPNLDLVKKFQTMLDIYSPGDDLYGVFESKTILKISEILNVKAKTPFEKKFEEANKKLAKINENNKEDIPSNLPKGDNLKKDIPSKKQEQKYDKLTIKVAKEIKRQGGVNPDPEKVKHFQDLTGISSQGNAEYGDWNSKTIEVWRDVLKEVQ